MQRNQWLIDIWDPPLLRSHRLFLSVQQRLTPLLLLTQAVVPASNHMSSAHRFC